MDLLGDAGGVVCVAPAMPTDTGFPGEAWIPVFLGSCPPSDLPLNIVVYSHFENYPMIHVQNYLY